MKTRVHPKHKLAMVNLALLIALITFSSNPLAAGAALVLAILLAFT